VNIGTTEIHDEDNNQNIKIYPNPVKDYLIIDFSDIAEMEGYSMKIINALGVIVYETPITQSLYEINLSTWTGKGTYVLHVFDQFNAVQAVRKIILQ